MPRHREKFLGGLLLAAGGILLLRFALISWDQLRAPFDLNYETQNLRIVQAIRKGLNPYAEETYARPPFIINIYTPLYSCLASLLPGMPENPFFPGRFLSLVSAAVCGVLLFLAGGPRGSFWPPFICAAAISGAGIICRHAAYFKCDPLALCLSGASVVALARAGSGRSGVIGSAFLAVLAVTSKQYFIAAGASCLLYLLFANRKAFFLYFAVAGGLSAVFAAFASLHWGSGFWFSTVGAIRQPFTPDNLSRIAGVMSRSPMFWFLAAAAAAAVCKTMREKGLEMFRESPFPFYLIISTAWALIAANRHGASASYYFESALAQGLWIVWTVRNLSAASLFRPAFLFFAALFLACGVWAMNFTRTDDYTWLRPDRVARITSRKACLMNAKRELRLRNPEVLSLFRQDCSHYFGGLTHINDPFLYLWLWEHGRLPLDPLLKALRQRRYDLVIAGDRQFPLTYSSHPFPYKDIFRTLDENYALAGSGCGFHFFLPRGGDG